MTIEEARALLAKSTGVMAQPAAARMPEDGFDWDPDVEKDDAAECAWLRSRVVSKDKDIAHLQSRYDSLQRELQQVVNALALEPEKLVAKQLVLLVKPQC